MGDGAGYFPLDIEGNKIASDLTDMFGKERADTIQKVKDIKNKTFPNLLEYKAKTPTDTGANLRQRTLRHAAWLLTAHKFDAKPPSELFRKWLRYLTWVGQDGWHPSATVIVDNNVVKETPSQAILITLKKSIDNDQPINFVWNPASSSEPGGLKVDITRTTRDPKAAMTIIVTSKKEVDITDKIASSDDDAFYF